MTHTFGQPLEHRPALQDAVARADLVEIFLTHDPIEWGDLLADALLAAAAEDAVPHALIAVTGQRIVHRAREESERTRA